MLDIFYYIHNDDLSEFLNFGIKLSENYYKKLNIDGNEKLFLSGLLNPKDDISKFNDSNYTCVKLNINNIYSKVAESSLYNTKLYNKTIIPIEEYTLGKYMNPEVLISQSILPEDIENINYEIDYPLLYNNSKELYINNLIENLSLKLNNSNDIMLKSLLDESFRKEKLIKEDLENGIVYYSKDNNEIYFCNNEF